MALGINIKYHRFFVLCYSVVFVIFQNYNLSKRFENLITRRDKIRFSLEKLIIRHVFTCLSKLIIIYIYIFTCLISSISYIYIFSAIHFVEK